MKTPRLLGALCAALLLSIAPLRAAEQSSYVTPITGPMNMATFAGAYLNPALRALASCNWGTSAPANGPSGAPLPYQCWADTTANPVLFKTYDGASWVTYAAINTSTHVWTPYRNGAPILAVATSGSAADLTTGTLAAARLPTPSASTLGGVQSKTCSASQWLNDVSTAGVLSCAQPNFTDIAGTAALAQLPAFSGMPAAAAAADADIFPTNQGAGNLKQTLAAVKTWIKAWIVKADVGLGNVDNTSDATKWAATKTLTNTTFNCGSTGNVCTVRLASDIAGFGTGVATALGVNVGSAGAPVLFNGAGGTPSSLVGTNITGTAAGLTAGNVTTNANLTGEVTSVGNSTTVTNSSVIGKLLTAFASGAGTVSSSDSILTAFQKVVGNIALKADIASPTFTGAPTAPTALPGTNTIQIATTAYADAIAALKANANRNIATGCGLAGGGDLSSDRTLRLSLAVNSQIGTSYSVVDGDCGKVIRLANAASVAVTLPQPGASFISGWTVDFQNTGTGTVTITSTASTINGSANLVLTTNQGAHCDSDGTNYTCVLGVGAGGGSGITSIVAGSGLTGGTITSSGTIAVDASPYIGTIEWAAYTRTPPNFLRADGTAVSRATYAALFTKLVYSSTVTFTSGSTDIGWTAHGLSAGDPIKLFTTGSLPANFTASTNGLPTVGANYCVISAGLTTNAFRVSSTCGGTAISAGSAGSGTQTAVNAPWGNGDGSSTFHLPQLMGTFVRGWDGGAGIDINRQFGLAQSDAMQGHTHTAAFQTGTGALPYGPSSAATVFSYNTNSAETTGPNNDGTNGVPRIATETRPRNNTLVPLIRYQ